MRRALLDTDTVSFYMKDNAAVKARVSDYLAVHDTVDIVAVTYYELRRGLVRANATTKLAGLEDLADLCTIWELDRRAAEHAADICAELWRKGEPLGDADILIAATARANGLALVTNNVGHFERVSGLAVDNWLT